MKKIFITLIFCISLYSLGFAQFITAPLPGAEVLVRGISELLYDAGRAQRYSQHSVRHVFNKPYVTKQYIPYENQMDENYGFKSVTPEEKTTMGYEEIIVNIPAGSIIEDYIFVDGQGEILFSGSKSILLNVDNKKISFELDYNINSNEEILGFDYDENRSTIISKPITVTVRYSPKYFTFDYSQNPYSEEVSEILQILDNTGKKTYYVLKPNLENIYEDFKFSRGENK